MTSHLLRVGLLLLMAISTGCDSPAARSRITHRKDNMRRTGDMFVEMETDRDKKLARTVDHFHRQHKTDVARTQENPAKIQKWMKDDFEDWEKRQPIYRRSIQEKSEGNLPNIERTLPYMLY